MISMKENSWKSHYTPNCCHAIRLLTSSFQGDDNGVITKVYMSYTLPCNWQDFFFFLKKRYPVSSHQAFIYDGIGCTRVNFQRWILCLSGLHATQHCTLGCLGSRSLTVWDITWLPYIWAVWPWLVADFWKVKFPHLEHYKGNAYGTGLLLLSESYSMYSV